MSGWNPKKEYGVAVQAKGYKKWTLPQEGDYGTLADATKELESMKEDTHLRGALVWRFAASSWLPVADGSMA